jgi:hypothetical protein
MILTVKNQNKINFSDSFDADFASPTPEVSFFNIFPDFSGKIVPGLLRKYR